MALEEQGGLFDWCRPTDNARAKLHRTPQRRFLAPSVTRQRPSSSRRSCELFADPGDALQTLTCVSSRKCALQSLGMMPNAAAKTKTTAPDKTLAHEPSGTLFASSAVILKCYSDLPRDSI